jgi:hypothetical protein
LHEYRITHLVGVDIAGVQGDPIPQTMRCYGLRDMPSLMLIDRAGHLRLHEFGRIDDLRPGIWPGRLCAEKGVSRSIRPTRPKPRRRALFICKFIMFVIKTTEMIQGLWGQP